MSLEELKGIKLFNGISDDVLKIFEPLLNEEQHKAGEVIFEEGSSGDRFYIIKEGEVAIRKLIDREEKRYKLIAIMVKGEFFGEMAIFLGQNRTAEAVTKTDVTLITISKKDLSALFSQSPESALKIMEFLTSVLMDRLRNTTKELVTVYETGRLVTGAHSVAELSECVMDSAFNAVRPDAGLFVVWNKFNMEFEVFEQRGFGFESGVSLPDDDPLIKWLIENKEPFLSFDLSNDSRISILSDAIYNGSSIIAAPFFSRSNLLGFIILLNKTGQNTFSYENMILLSAISGYVSVSLENMQHIQEEIDRARLSQAKSSIRF